MGSRQTKKSLVQKEHTKSLQARGDNQKVYLESIKNSTITFGIGPAGTGKSLCAVAAAVTSYMAGEVDKIILIRPAVEAGEKLGYLPGTLEEKIAIYLTPLLEALEERIVPSELATMLRSGDIEFVTIAHSRGRNYKHAFVIIDEAQNTTADQMLMLLTRLSEGSKMVITGDPSQNDLPRNVKSGLEYAEQAFSDIDDIKFCYLDKTDIVRHPLVAKIVSANEDYVSKRKS